MNLHPLFVHFPIAILTLYAVCELIPNARLRRSEFFRNFKAIMAILGVLFAYVAAFFGDMAEESIHATGSLRQLVELHSTFAVAATVIFTILAAAYLVLWFETTSWSGSYFLTNGWAAPIWRLKRYLAHLILDARLAAVLALTGLICITITGGLGAIIVYGTASDPFFAYIYHTFFNTSGVDPAPLISR